MILRIKARRLIACAIFAAAFVGNSQSQDSRRVPERVLAGVSIDSGSAQELQRRFGEPDIVSEGQLYSNKTRTFEWQRGAVRVRVVKLADKPSDDSIISIEVSGSHNDGGIGITGQGLQLGDKLADARRIYTARLQQLHRRGVQSNGVARRAIVRVDSDLPELEIECNESGFITHLKLTNPCIPFCF